MKQWLPHCFSLSKKTQVEKLHALGRGNLGRGSGSIQNAFMMVLGSETSRQIPEPTGFNHYPTIPVQGQTHKELWEQRRKESSPAWVSKNGTHFLSDLHKSVSIQANTKGNTQLWPPVPSPQSRPVHKTNTVDFISAHHVISQLGLGKLTKEHMLGLLYVV